MGILPTIYCTPQHGGYNIQPRLHKFNDFSTEVNHLDATCLKALLYAKLRKDPLVCGVGNRWLRKCRKSLVFKRFGSFWSVVLLTPRSSGFS
jgi:hypothetical protein